MTDLEARYRTVLLWYPSTWREQNADAVVGTLMDEADATGRARPRPSELASLALHGLQARFGRAITVSRGTRDRLAAVAFGTGFALMAIMFLGGEWAPLAPAHDWGPNFGPFQSAAVVVNGVWVVAFGLAIAGLRRWAAAVLIVSVAASVAAIVLINYSPLLYGRPPATALTLMIVLALLALLGRPTRRTLLVSASAASVIFLAFCAQQYASNTWRFNGWLGDGWLVTANGWIAIALLALAGAAVALRRSEWVTPLAASGIVWSLYSIGTGYTNHRDLLVVFAGVGGLVVAVLALAAASLALRGYRLQVVRVTSEA